MLADTGFKSIGAIRDHSGQTLAYVYFEEEPGRRSAAKLLATFNLGIRTGSTWDCP